MHLLLTDRLVCPRCGPEFGLILLAHEVMERRILEGELGCPNCREQHPVRGGFADLRGAPRDPLPAGSTSDDPPPLDPEETLRLGALLGVTEGPGTLLVLGPLARFAGALSDLVGQVEVVGLDPSLGIYPERHGVSRMAAGSRVPFSSGSFLGVLLSGGGREGELREAARVVSPLGRVVVAEALPGTRQQLEEWGFSVLLEEDDFVVGQRDGREPLPLVTLRGP